MPSILGKKSRAASLAILTMGMTFDSFCSAIDIKQNAIAGTMGFIEGWVEDLWGEFIPTPGEIVGGDEG